MGLRVVTFNICHGESLSGQIDLEGQAALLRSLAPDFVFLQEVDCRTERSGFTDQAEQLARLVGLPHFAFGPNRSCIGGTYGNAILSRFAPLFVDNTLIPIDEPDRPRVWRNGDLVHLEQRGILRVTVDPGHGPVHLLCTHFGYFAEERPIAARLVAEIVRNLEGPVIFAGDLNEPDDESEELAILRRDMTDCALSALQDGVGTYPADSPCERLDYIFARGYRPSFLTVVPTDSSDHCPVAAELVPEPTVLLKPAVPKEAVPRGARPSVGAH